MQIQHLRLTILMSIATLLLFIPFIAMQFTNEVNWGLFDFVMAAVLLYGTGLLFELVLRKVRKPVYRIVICAVILVLLLVIWIELAVGIFGTAIAGK